MLVNNFSAGILGFAPRDHRLLPASPRWSTRSSRLPRRRGRDCLVNAGLLPLASIIIEPAKILFLNNAINHGVLDPARRRSRPTETGKSILFLLEANPGPGLGILLAFAVFGVGAAACLGSRRDHHPVLRWHPRDLLPVRADEAAARCSPLILGGATGVAHQRALPLRSRRTGVARLDHRGPRARHARDSYVGVILSVILSAAVSFVVAVDHHPRQPQARPRRQRGRRQTTLSPDAVAANAANKGKRQRASATLARRAGADSRSDRSGVGTVATTTATSVDNIVFACDAGMGSSAMGATVLRNKIKKAGIDGRHGRQQGDREPHRRRRPGHHAAGADRPREAEDARAPSTSRSTTS